MKYIEVINWEKYNPRSKNEVLKYHSHWFRLESSLLTSPQFYDWSAEELMVMISIFALQCQAQWKPFLLNISQISKIARAKVKVTNEVLAKLEQFHIIKVTVQQSVQNCTYITEQNITEQNKNTLEHCAQVFDFEIFYQKYPRKLGKQSGINKCKAQIKTQADYDNLSLAIDRYLKYISEKQIEPQYIKHFSTFMTSWRDWLDPQVGQSIDAKKLADDAWIREKELEMGIDHAAE